MIGKPNWFTYRIFGWGIRPKKWQGWAYILVFMAAVFLTFMLPLAENIKIWIIGIIIAIGVIDALHLMMLLPKVHDERENRNQLIIERNVSFAGIAALVIVMLYQAYKNNFTGEMPFDPALIVVVLIMLAVKIVSTIYLRFKS